MRAGDIRRRGTPAVRVAEVVEIRAQSAVGKVGRVTIDRILLGHRYQIQDAIGRHLTRSVGVAIGEPRVPGFEQQLVVHRRRPRRLRDPVGKIEIAGVGLRRLCRRPERNPVGAAGTTARAVGGQRRTFATGLILLRKRDPVPRRELRGGAHRPDVASLHKARLDGVVPLVVPVRRVADVLVGADARDARRGRILAVAGEEPQPILLDRSANRSARVIRALDARAPGDALGSQRVVDVVAARPVTRRVEERLSRELVAAGLGHDVHRWTAGLVLAEAARHQHRDFFGVVRIVGERRDSAPVERRGDSHAVDRHPALVGASAVRAEERHRRRGGQAVVVDRHARHRVQ